MTRPIPEIIADLRNRWRDDQDHLGLEAADALEQSLAMVAAAYEAAAGKVRNHRAWLNFRAMEQLLKDEPLPEPLVAAFSKLLNGIADTIQADAHADALAALDRERRKARNAALEEAAEKVKQSLCHGCRSATPTGYHDEAAHMTAEAIRAMKEDE